MIADAASPAVTPKRFSHLRGGSHNHTVVQDSAGRNPLHRETIDGACELDGENLGPVVWPVQGMFLAVDPLPACFGPKRQSSVVRAGT
jgi:hypothetical protein